jgi:protein involved in polysaccharide export with SLBB domain
MKKLLLLIILVIILVSLNWFTKAHAQDLGQMSDDEKAVLLQKYQSMAKNRNTSTQIYESPTIYDSSSVTRLPESRTTKSATQQKANPPTVDASGKPLSTTETTRPAAPKENLQEFDDLKPFGLELFAGPRESAPPDDIASAGDYILGPGDNVVISLWGRVEGEYNLTVDREGKVFIPKIGELAVWGKSLDDFRTYAHNRFSQVYSEFQLNVSLGKIRSIRIYLTGEVNHPGAYTVSSLTSLFNALYLAGGPNENGSMRDIRLMRGGKQVVSLDLYKFLLEGDNRSDLRLESGDAIFVPVAGTRVAIRGQIRRPAIYELTHNETSLELVKLAGNALPQAHLDRVLLERITPKGEWEVRDLNLNSQNEQSVTNIALNDGDRMTIYSIFDFKKNMVSVGGQVKHPGVYERGDKSRVLDLVLRGELQDYDVYFDRADLFRRHADYRVEVIPVSLSAILAGDSTQNVLLSDRDSLYVYRIQDVVRDKSVFIGGEVDRPGIYPLYDRMTVGDLIFLAGSYSRAASRLQGEIARIDSLGNVSIDYVNLTDSSSLASVLDDDDRVYIRTIPEWRLHRTVKIDGEVMYPGEYVMSSREETLSSLLKRAGGFTHNSFPKGAVFERRSISRSLEQMQVGKVLENSAPIVEDSLGRLHSELIINYDSSQVSRIIIDVDKVLASNGKLGDLVLQPGDRIHIPPIPSGITIVGAVGSTGTIKYSGGHDVRHYVRQAGNFTPRADKKGTRLIKANGAVYSGGDVLGKRVEEGDVIVVPAKIEKDSNWLKTATTALAATSSLLTTVLVIDRL